VKPSSRYSIVRILPASSSNSYPIHTVFCDFSVQSKFYFEMRMLLSLQPGAHFADLIFQKCSRSHPLSFICYGFYVKLIEIELAKESSAHFADLIFQKCSGRLSF
jgi:hypothetical protein